jgi:2-C-methyl-D-erythritol 2,4-cyclodiphosphate synthase
VSFRIGHGYDIHRLVDNRRLVLGGVEIPFGKGLEGHSDADVVLHALADALLGAAGLPDIGQQFPPTDNQYKDADSLHLLELVVNKVREAGFSEIVNVDITVQAERPLLNEYIPRMKARIAPVLGIDESRVGIKATTTEGLGFVGREEGIAAGAVCLLAE